MNVDPPLVAQRNQSLDNLGKVDGEVSLGLVQVLNGGRVSEAGDPRLDSGGVTVKKN